MPYTPINNDFFKTFLPTQDLTGGEFRVLMFIFWRTTCFNSTYHEAGTDFIANGTGLSRRQVIRIVQSLCDKGLIRIRSKGIGSHPQIIEISGDIDGYRWGHRRSNSGDTDGKKMTNHVTQEIKEEIKEKEIKEEEKASPTFSSEEEWRAWMETQDVEED